jgi:hypothetical protein
MSALFRTPRVNVPKAEAPPPVPTIDEGARQRVEGDRLRRRRGVRGNVFAGGMMGVVPQNATAVKTATGQ